MFFGKKFVEFGQLVVLLRLPLPSDFQNGEKPLSVLAQMLRKVFNENVGAQPFEVAVVLCLEGVVACLTGVIKISEGFGGDFGGLSGGGFIRAKKSAIAVVIVGACIKYR